MRFFVLTYSPPRMFCCLSSFILTSSLHARLVSLLPRLYFIVFLFMFLTFQVPPLLATMRGRLLSSGIVVAMFPSLLFIVSNVS